METKPLKRDPHIVSLSKQHHTTLLFCWKIRQGIRLGADPERMKNYVKYFFTAHLEPHFLEEEKILFPAIKDDKVDRAILEHRLLKQHAEKIFSLSGRDLIDSLSEFANAVDNHVRFEERELFPHLEKTLSEAALETIGKKLHDKPVAADEFRDEFWKK